MTKNTKSTWIAKNKTYSKIQGTSYYETYSAMRSQDDWD